MQELFNLLNEIGLPYFRQGSLSDEEYPASFFTYWNHGSPTDSFYDNSERRYIEHVQIGWYTNDAKLLYSQLDEGGEFYKKAKEKGFVLTSRPQDTDADKANYYGRLVFIKIIHKTED